MADFDVEEFLKAVDKHYEDKEIKERARAQRIRDEEYKRWLAKTDAEAKARENEEERKKMSHFSKEEALAYYDEKRHSQEAKRNEERAKALFLMFATIVIPVILGYIFVYNNFSRMFSMFW